MDEKEPRVRVESQIERKDMAIFQVRDDSDLDRVIAVQVDEVDRYDTDVLES